MKLTNVALVAAAAVQAAVLPEQADVVERRAIKSVGREQALSCGAYYGAGGDLYYADGEFQHLCRFDGKRTIGY